MFYYPHGSYDIRFLGEVVSLNLKGSWNLEMAEQFFRECQAMILEKKLRRFGVMTDFRELEGATPDCIAFFKVLPSWAKAQGQVARAQILDSGLKAYIAEQNTKQKDFFPIRSFDNKEDALAWLSDLGLQTD